MKPTKASFVHRHNSSGAHIPAAAGGASGNGKGKPPVIDRNTIKRVLGLDQAGMGSQVPVDIQISIHALLFLKKTPVLVIPIQIEFSGIA